jgi:transcription termination factor Rho
MELVLDRRLSEKRVFPAIDIPRSGTRREDLLLAADELEAINIIRKALNGMKPEEAVDKVLDMFAKTRNNQEFVNMVKKIKWI